MDRLSVRLSIVGAVLVLGSAAIAHSIMSKRQGEPEVHPANGTEIVQAKTDSPPEPIPASDSDQAAPTAALQPPTDFADTDFERAPDSANTPASDPLASQAVDDPQPSPSPYALPVGNLATQVTGLAADTSENGATAEAAGDSRFANQPPPGPTAFMASSDGASSLTRPAFGTNRTFVADDSEANETAANRTPSSVYGAAIAQTTAAGPVSSQATAEDSVAASLSDDNDQSVESVDPTGQADTGSAIPADPTAGGMSMDDPASLPNASATDGAASRYTEQSPSRWSTSDAAPVVGAHQINDPVPAEADSAAPESRELSTSAATTPSAPASGSQQEPETVPTSPATGPMAAQATAEPSSDPNPLPAASNPSSSYGQSSPYSGQPAAFGERSSSPSYEPADQMAESSSDLANTESSSPAAASSITSDGPTDTNRGVTTQADITPSPTPGSNVPGDQQLEGQQTASLTLEKIAPDEIQVDRQATFQIRVRNVGGVPAENVMVVDRIPAGTEFVDAVPACDQTADGMLIWQLGTIPANGDATLNVQLVPKEEREIGSVAYVSFQAKASVRSICTKPQLAVKCETPPTVLIGDSVTLDITVTNTGSGAARNVVLQEDVPDGLDFHAGRELEQDIGTLEPNESVRLSLALDSVRQGHFQNKLTVLDQGQVHDQLLTDIQVVAPALEVSLTGPSRRFLGREASYTIQVANPGTAAARNVELIAYLPKGMKYVTSDNQGQYDGDSHAVYWSLDELPATKQGEAHVTLVPVEPGDQKLKVDGKATAGLHETYVHSIAVEGLAELVFTVKDLADPIEVGSDTKYEIRVVNQGTQQDTNIQVAAELPPALKLTDATGPSQATIEGQQVLFAPLPSLAPDEEVIYSLYAQGDESGQHVIRVQLQSDGLSVPVLKEENTRVYTDQ